ncbi:unnamed protein product [Rhizoctonia solani]|uniref:Uncharacterized protein n=1 Tax=Rhizoctonia solani TaxID=456999 RepID=A0A8H3AIN3_9AGAM|nr:unnamed protein product [Rhizoctonia solani]
MSSEENFDTHDSDCPHPRGRPEYGVEARCLIYPPDTRVRVRFNGSSYEAIIVNVEPNGYVVRDNNGNYHHVQHGEILQAIP